MHFPQCVRNASANGSCQKNQHRQYSPNRQSLPKLLRLMDGGQRGSGQNFGWLAIGEAPPCTAAGALLT